MSEMNVHLTDVLPEAREAQFRRAIRNAGRLTFGADAPEDTTVLIDGAAGPEILEKLPALESVVVPWAGVNEKLLSMAREKGLAVYNLHHNAAATAETAIALLLAVAKEIVPRDRELRRGHWQYRFSAGGAVQLAGKTAVVLGLGAIGKRVAQACRGLHMDVLGVRRARKTDDPSWVFGVDEIDDLLPRAEVLIVTLPLTRETRGLIGRKRLGLLPKGAILVNVGRGAVVDEDPLYEALTFKRLGGAGLDVWYRYPKDEEDAQSLFPGNRPFHWLDNVVLSPHQGGAFQGNEEARLDAIAELLREMADGSADRNKVDLELGY